MNMKENTLKRLMILWIAVAVVGGCVALLSVLVPIGNVHHASRTIKRLSDLAVAPASFTATAQEYKDACTDGKYLWEAMGTMTNVGFFGGVVIILLSVFGLVITFATTKRINSAQH